MKNLVKKSMSLLLAFLMMFSIFAGTTRVFAQDETNATLEKKANKNLESLQLLHSNADPVSTKTFTVTKYPIAGSSNETLVGEYDTFYDAIGACKQEDLSNQYVVTMNKDYTIPETESSWGKSSVNILLKSKKGHRYTLKRIGKRDIMTVYSKCTFRIENVVLDGNKDGQAFMVAGGSDSLGAELILGKGTVIQNFKDIDNYLGTTFYLAEGNSILTIEVGAILQNNTAKESGGVIQGRKNTIINIKGGTFINNSSKSGGGAIFTSGKLNITGGTFDSNQGKYGGALWIGSESTATVENATFRNNKANISNGGAIWSSNEFKVKNSIFEMNHSPKWGAAIVGQKGMTIENSTFKNNVAPIGGALAIYPSTKITVKDSSFTGNSATSAGAIYILSSKEKSTISGCIFTDNKATAKGGAIWANDASISIEGSTFKNNGNGTQYGGGLLVNGDKSYNVKNSTFNGNKAKLGGGIFVIGGKLSVEETTLESNIAETETNQQGNIIKGVGGAILSLKDEAKKSEMNISKSIIKNNEARNGAGVTVESGNVKIKNTEFNGNNTKGSEDEQDKLLGGALYVDVDANVNISDESKFINNKAGMGGAIFDASSDYSNPADVSKYQNLEMDGTTLFKGNKASIGLYNPPSNFDKFNKLLFSEISDVPHNKYMSKSLLNNYDINYKSGFLITYDANGGKFIDDKSIKQELHKANDTITIIGAPVRDEYQFLYWKGSKYNPGDSYIIKDNHTFVAQWNKIPELEVKNKTIKQGENLNFMSLVVSAKDKEDGDLTKDVKIVDNGGFNKDNVGNYTVIFKVTDKDGAGVTKKAVVTVIKKDKPKPKPDYNGRGETTPNITDRVHGYDRIETGIKLSQKYYGKAKTVIVVRHELFPDSMTASVLAKLKDAPILLNSTGRLDPRVGAEIKRLGAEEIIIVGGPDSISENVREDLKDYDNDKDVERIAGVDRYGTSEMVARRVTSITGKKDIGVIASGQVFSDALSVGTFASREGFPILLVKKNQVPDQVLRAIKDLEIKKIYIAGGTNSISKSTESKLPTVVERMAGKDRYETSVAIAKTKFKDSKEVFIASGEEFADALVISPVSGKYNRPTLLASRNNRTNSVVKKYIEESYFTSITAIGGQDYLPNSILLDLAGK